MLAESVKDKRVRVNTATSIASQVRAMAMEKGPHFKLPTTRDLCSAFNTGPATLNDALAVLEAQHVIFRKQGSGIYVSPKIHRKTIAIVCSSNLLMAEGASPFWGLLLGQFAKQAITRGEELNQDFEFFMTPPSAAEHTSMPDNMMRAVRAGSIHGVVALGLSNDGVQWLWDQGVPCVAFAGSSKLIVSTAVERLILAGLRVLVEQGCQSIEYWGLPRPDETNQNWYAEMCRDVEKAYRTVSLELPPTPIGPAPDLVTGSGVLGEDETYPYYRGYMAIKTLFGDPKRPRPDGLVIGDDMMAHGVVVGLLSMGVRVGVDIKIASHANRKSGILCGVAQEITLLEYDPAEIADALVQLLDRAMADPNLPDTEVSVPFRIRLPDGCSDHDIGVVV